MVVTSAEAQDANMSQRPNLDFANAHPDTADRFSALGLIRRWITVQEVSWKTPAS